MKKMWKKLLALTLAVSMTMSLLNLTVFASSVNCIDGKHEGRPETYIGPSREKPGFKAYLCVKCGQAVWYNGSTYHGAVGAGEVEPEKCNHLRQETEITATCTEDGKKVVTCIDCNTVLEEVEIPALDHTFEGATWTDNCETHKDEACTGHTMTCTRCNGSEKDGEVTQEHSYGDWKTVTEATAGVAGEEQRICKDCGHIEIREITALPVPTKPIKDIQARYIVQWLDENGKELKTADMSRVDEIGKTVSATDADKADITDAAGNVYSFDESAANVLEGTLSKDSVVILKLYFTKTAVPTKPVTPSDKMGYLVQWFDASNGSKLKEEIRQDTIGQTVTEGEHDKDSFKVDEVTYVYDNTDSRNVLSGTLSKDSVVTLKLYFTATVPGSEMELHARYIVQYLDENGNELKPADMSRVDEIGKTVSATEEDKADITDAAGNVYSFDESAANELSAELKEIKSADDIVTLTLYFTKVEQPQPETATYTVEWLINNVGTYKTENRTGTVGETVEVTEADKTLAGYTFIADSTENKLSATLAEEGTKLVLLFQANSVDHDPVTPTPTPTPSTEPSNSPEPSEPVEEIEETQPPLTEEPEATDPAEEPTEEEDLDEGETPLAETPDLEPEESEDLENGEVPLAEVPQTGDHLALWLVLSMLSAMGLCHIQLTEKKGKRSAR